MRSLPLLVAAPLLLAAPLAGLDCAKTSYGKGVTLADSTPIPTLLARAEEYVGKPVRVDGVVADVCAMAGCWMEIRAAEGGEVVKVKVEDGEIVFPVAARGKQAVAEGELERLEMDRAQYVRWAKHAAEERGQGFDQAGIGAGPFRVYQIRGTGAEVCAD
jgi:hypothetical protein